MINGIYGKRLLALCRIFQGLSPKRGAYPQLLGSFPHPCTPNLGLQTLEVDDLIIKRLQVDELTVTENLVLPEAGMGKK